ncbi:MAG: ATP-binding protein [Halieaceae bacterium]
MSTSLRKRLIIILAALTLFAWIGSAGLTGIYASRVLIDQVDRQLEQYSVLVSYITRVFAAQMDKGETLPGIDVAEMGDETPMIIETPASEGLAPVVNIFYRGQLQAVLENSPRFEPPAEEGFSFRLTEEGHNHWRLLARYDERNDLWVLVGIELDQARWALWRSFARVLFPLMIILPLTMGLLYFGVARGLLPLKNLAAQIGRRNPQQLDPVGSDTVPEEMKSMVGALNELLERLAFALESEQRFTANAAHELMTPLAAIKTEVQLCQRQLTETSAVTMLQRIAERVDRATHTVEQLLTLARVDPDAPLVKTSVALRSLLIEVLAENAHLAIDRDVQVDIKDGEEVMVQASEESIAILLRNLLVNAFRYASAGSTVTVRLDELEAGVELEICNDCERLSTAEFERLGERFYRVPGSAGLGAGLGLSIVQRITDQHQAQFTAHPGNSGSGFCARLRLPA